jgi:hypothetical protein
VGRTTHGQKSGDRHHYNQFLHHLSFHELPSTLPRPQVRSIGRSPDFAEIIAPGALRDLE